jgi:hypothetical protein
MTREEVASFLAAMHGAWPNTEVDEAVAYVWGEALRYIDYDEGLSVLTDLINTKVMFPTVADFNAALSQHRITQRRRAEMDHRQVAEGHTTPPSRGVAIAIEAYKDECRRQGREPSSEIFSRWLAVTSTE